MKFLVLLIYLSASKAGLFKRLNFVQNYKNHNLIETNSQNLIHPNSVVSNYRLENQFHDQLDNFYSYKNEMDNLLNNELKQNLKTLPKNITKNKKNIIQKHITFDPFENSYQQKLSIKKLQRPKLCRCQIRKMARIVNGQTAEPNSIPWQVSLANRQNHFCGGTIINEVWVLTAAHCIWDSQTSDVQVRVGLHQLNDSQISKKTYKVDKIYVHPSYNDENDASAPGDIGLIKLKTPIKFIEGRIEPACLGLSNKKFSAKVMASGWGSILPTMSGRKEFHGKLSNVLKKADFTTRSSCESSSLICIKAVHKGQSICDGDSGGPLHSLGAKRTSVIGVCSFGLGKPISKDTVKYCLGDGAYTRLSAYKSFISKYIGNSYCPG